MTGGMLAGGWSEGVEQWEGRKEGKENSRTLGLHSRISKQ